METDGWLDKYTNKVEIAIPVFAAEFGLHTLLTVNFYFSRGGHVWKQIITHSTYASWYQFQYYILYDMIWLCCLVHIVRMEFLEIRRTISLKGCVALWTDYLSFWNIVDWASIAGGFTIVALCMTSLNGSAKCNREVALLAETDFADREAYHNQLTVYMDALQSNVRYVHVMKLVLAAYPLVIVMRLFKAFSAQARLALVANTLIVAGVDLAHFMVIFTSVFVTLTMSGQVLFGRRVSSFATFPRAVNSVFRLMLGEFEWDEIRNTGLFTGACWLIVTVSSLSILLLNFLLAIVMDAYGEVKHHSGNSPTLFEDANKLWKRWLGVSRGQRVPLGAVRNIVVNMERNMTVPQDDELVPGQFGKPILIGLDSRPSRGMKVIPVDESVSHFTGPGRVSQIGSCGLVCRVQHDTEGLREYRIGKDALNELMLFSDEIPEPRHMASFLEFRSTITDGGQVLAVEGIDCIASFPGLYSRGWGAEFDPRLMSVASVFLHPDAPELGQHAKNPDASQAGQNPCYCRTIYGERDYKKMGYLIWIPRKASKDERHRLQAYAERTGAVLVEESLASVQECIGKAEQAKRRFEENGGVAAWGCKWFSHWTRRIQEAAARKQRLLVYFYQGDVGKGKRKWEYLADKRKDPWDGIGLGGSQKCEVAYLDLMRKEKGSAYDYVECDVAELIGRQLASQVDGELKRARWAQVDHLVSPFRLHREVSAQVDTARFTQEQAIEILGDAALHFYEQHCVNKVPFDVLRRKIGKVKYRLRKITDATALRAAKTLSAYDEMKLLRQFLADFFEAVAADRRIAHERIWRLRSDIEKLRRQLSKPVLHSHRYGHGSTVESRARSDALALGNAKLPVDLADVGLGAVDGSDIQSLDPESEESFWSEDHFEI